MVYTLVLLESFSSVNEESDPNERKNGRDLDCQTQVGDPLVKVIVDYQQNLLIDGKESIMGTDEYAYTTHIYTHREMLEPRSITIASY